MGIITNEPAPFLLQEKATYNLCLSPAQRSCISIFIEYADSHDYFSYGKHCITHLAEVLWLLALIVAVGATPADRLPSIQRLARDCMVIGA
jgi:hypothetical protein